MDDAMTPDCPPPMRRRHIQLPREPASAAAARRQVRAIIRIWRLPVDPDIAVLLTSDLITSVITAGTGPVVGLGVSCPGDHLRIGASDTSWTPWPAEDPAAAEARPGLALVAALSADWACYRTSAGPAAYFTLTFMPAPQRVTLPACPDGRRTGRRRAVVGAGRG
jgi:hypothetical protein